MRPAKVVAIVGGVLLTLLGLALFAPGLFLFWVHGTQRDSAGFYETPDRVVSTSAYAVASPDVDLGIEPLNWEWVREGAAGTVRVAAESRSSTPLFIGIGPSDRVSEYLSDVAHDEVTDMSVWSRRVDYRHADGGAPRSAPGEQDFWVVEQEGLGTQTLEWQAQSGSWTAVMMNADGSARVAADLSVGAEIGLLLYIAIGLTSAGAVLLAFGIFLAVVGVMSPRPAPPVSPSPPPGYVSQVGPEPTGTAV